MGRPGSPEGNVDALAAAETAADDHLAMNVLAGHTLDAEVDDTVAEEQRVADANLGGKPRVRDGDAITGALDLASGEGELGSGLELDATGRQSADADLLAREILEAAVDTSSSSLSARILARTAACSAGSP